jgi:type IV secretory pathway TraG/TraD family ATPase VirD4
LLSAQDILQMPADAVIAFHRDLPPVRLRRANWLEHSALVARQGLPVPLVAELPAAPALPELDLGSDTVVQPAPATSKHIRRERTNGHQQALDFGDRW